jgi:regulator of replication initiation timing
LEATKRGLALMKRKALAIVLITVIAVSATTWLVHNQISDLQNQISKLQAQNSDLHEQVSELQDQNTELQNQTSELKKQLNDLQNQTYRGLNVEITAFEWIGGYHHLGQVNLFQNFKVTIENMGNNNVSGLTLSVKLLSVGTNAKIGEYTKQIDIIRAGQIVEISGFVSVGDIGSYAHTAVGVITLTLGDVLLGQWIRNLEGSF